MFSQFSIAFPKTLLFFNLKNSSSISLFFFRDLRSYQYVVLTKYTKKMFWVCNNVISNHFRLEKNGIYYFKVKRSGNPFWTFYEIWSRFGSELLYWFRGIESKKSYQNSNIICWFWSNGSNTRPKIF